MHWQRRTFCAFSSRTSNTQLLHFVNQRSALETKFGGCALWSTNDPTDCFERAKNQRAFRVPQRSGSRRGDEVLRRRRWQGIGKHSIICEYYGAFNQVL